jgi:hypothetical protein
MIRKRSQDGSCSAPSTQFLRLVFEDGSDFEVRVEPGAETGAFELVECTGGPTRKVTLDLGLLT